MKICAMVATVYGLLSVVKCLYFVNRSTTTKMTYFPLNFGGPAMKFIEIPVKMACDMASS